MVNLNRTRRDVTYLRSTLLKLVNLMKNSGTKTRIRSKIYRHNGKPRYSNMGGVRMTSQARANRDLHTLLSVAQRVNQLNRPNPTNNEQHQNWNLHKKNLNYIVNSLKKRNTRRVSMNPTPNNIFNNRRKEFNEIKKAQLPSFTSPKSNGVYHPGQTPAYDYMLRVNNPTTNNRKGGHPRHITARPFNPNQANRHSNGTRTSNGLARSHL